MSPLPFDYDWVFHEKTRKNYYRPKDGTVPYGMYLGYPLPETLTLDEYGVPTHPFWRLFYFKRLLDPDSPSFVWPNNSQRWANPIPKNGDYDYFFRISDYYWKYGVDLRRYRTTIHGERFAMPLPGHEAVPRDEEGLPINTYWLFTYLKREINPNYLIPLYDEHGVPLYTDDLFKYKLLNQHPYWYDFLKKPHPPPFDRSAFLKAYRSGKKFFSGDEYIDEEILHLLNNSYPGYGDDYLKTYDQICARLKNDLPFLVPLITPTVADLAVAYVTLKHNPHAALDERKFPQGFTPEHRQWLIAAANPSTVQYLQIHAGAGDSVLTEILLKNQKQLQNPKLKLL